ncbi:MAG: glycosyltransferase family 4 protein [Saprospiraceae bacterium]|nr:glycosyltransferase family 4 protein [Saprospiraceae bacterium]
MRLARLPWIVLKTDLDCNKEKWKWRLGLANHIVCISRVQQSLLSKYVNKISLIIIGIDTKVFSKKSPYKRAEFNLQLEDIVLACIAYLIPDKGHRELIRATALIKEKVPNLKILLIGKGNPDYEEELKRIICEFALQKVFIFLGARDDVPQLLPLADGGILTSQNYGRKEGFGVALVEAMATALPVIGTRSGGLEEIIQDGVNGWLVEADDLDALSKAILDFTRILLKGKD